MNTGALALILVAVTSVPWGGPVAQYGPAGENITLSIDFGNGTLIEYTGLSGPDVLNVTMSVANVSVRWYGDLVFVESINGIANDPAAGKWWQYWVNGQYGPIASNKYVLSDSDSVSWKRTGNAFAGNDGNELQLTSTVMVVGGAVLIAATLASLGKRLRR
ncbi:MAG: DUF4430 domain-containing protein [Candidatus Thorarchaeota archaeon]